MPLSSQYIGNRGVNAGAGRRITPSALIHEIFTNPMLADADGISASHVGAAVAGTTSMTIGGALATGGVATMDTGTLNSVPTGMARNAVIVVTHGSAVVAMNGVITGTDMYGNVITETWSVTAGTASKTYTGAKAFRTVTGITEIIAADASANTIIAGQGIKIGLTAICIAASCVKEYAAGSLVTNGTLVAGVAAHAVSDPHGTYAPNTAPDGANDYEIYYISDHPELSNA